MEDERKFELPKGEIIVEPTIDEGIIDDPKGKWWEKLPPGVKPEDIETWVEWIDNKSVLHWCKKGTKSKPELNWPRK